MGRITEKTTNTGTKHAFDAVAEMVNKLRKRIENGM